MGGGAVLGVWELRQAIEGLGAEPQELKKFVLKKNNLILSLFK